MEKFGVLKNFQKSLSAPQVVDLYDDIGQPKPVLLVGGKSTWRRASSRRHATIFIKAEDPCDSPCRLTMRLFV